MRRRHSQTLCLCANHQGLEWQKCKVGLTWLAGRGGVDEGHCELAFGCSTSLDMIG